jgi:5'-AMP-activated protein kinase catalytic alpha subunit
MEKIKTIGHYTLGSKIGAGTFGYVRTGTHSISSSQVAVKILEKRKICDSSDIERVSREIHILKMIRHPHVIQLYEIIETSKQLFLIMELAGGVLLCHFICVYCRWGTF